MTALQAVDRSPITDELLVQLATIAAWLTIYDAVVPDHPPAISPTDQRVKPYAVVYPFGGHQSSDGTVGGESQDLVYGCQITVAAGHRKDCENAVDKVAAFMFGLVLDVDGLACGKFAPPFGSEPGPIQRDTVVVPPRFYLPLNYRMTALNIA